MFINKYAVMDPRIFIAKIDDYSARKGWKASTICLRVFKDPHRYARLKRRMEQLEREFETLDDFIRENPPPPTPALPTRRRRSTNA